MLLSENGGYADISKPAIRVRAYIDAPAILSRKKKKVFVKVYSVQLSKEYLFRHSTL